MRFTRPRILYIQVCCLIFSLSLTLTFLTGTATPQNRSKTQQPKVSMVGTPKWWIVPRQEGNTNEGKLYFGAVIQNDSDVAINIGLSFQSYLADGTKYEGCYQVGGSGPGVSDEIAPREKALLVCNRAIVPRSLQGLQITSRLWDVYAIDKKSPDALVVESGLVTEDWGLDKEHRKYNAFARVKTLIKRDTKAQVLFRFYSDNGIQVATCRSTDVLIEPEVTLKTTCSGSIFVDAGSPQPKTVRAEVRHAAW